MVAPRPVNNVVRVSVETMAAVLGGAQSIFTGAYDEAYQIPTGEWEVIAAAPAAIFSRSLAAAFTYLSRELSDRPGG